jgi:ferric-dicitrate binding protein FerR (iron transport regulator)
MTRLEELTLNLADDVLSDAEESELQGLLGESEQARQIHIRILQIEAGLRAQKQPAELSQHVMAELRRERADSMARGVMTQIKTQPSPKWRRNAGPNLLPFRFNARTFARVWLPLAACFVLLAGIGFWLFGAVIGKPMLSEVTGPNISLERAGNSVAATAGTSLRDGDTLRIRGGSTAIITFAPENTRLTLLPGTEFKLRSLSGGKLFELDVGKLEASVARQRPFRPMLVKTPQAVARVIGTRFTLTVTTNSTRLDVAEGLIRFTRTSDEQSVRVGSQHSAVAANFEMNALPFTGSILREYWTNVPVSYSTINLRANPKFPDHPDGRDYLKKFETPNHLGTNYGARISGYLQPPVTGEYSFWIIAGNYGELYLSSDDKPENRTWIAHSQDGKPGDWDAAQHQHTSSIKLTAGRSYLIEARQIEGSDGNDYLAVAWQGPGRPREIIPGDFLAPLEPPKGKDQ